MTVLTAVLIQVLVLVLTLAAAGGAVPVPADRPVATSMVDASVTVQAPSGRTSRVHALESARAPAACPSVTAGRAVAWVSQGRGPMPPPMA